MLFVFSLYKHIFASNVFSDAESGMLQLLTPFFTLLFFSNVLSTQDIPLLPDDSTHNLRESVLHELWAYRDEPTEYFTTTISEMEGNLLPVNWNENGISAFGNFGKGQHWHYNLSIINGLDNSAFSQAECNVALKNVLRP
jgi:hypothetical protein